MTADSPEGRDPEARVAAAECHWDGNREAGWCRTHKQSIWVCVATLRAHLAERAGQLVAAQAALRKWREYDAWAREKNQAPVMLAWAHGWRCPEADIAEGKRRRDELDALAAPPRAPQPES